jgi:hypothetical protein
MAHRHIYQVQELASIGFHAQISMKRSGIRNQSVSIRTMVDDQYLVFLICRNFSDLLEA